MLITQSDLTGEDWATAVQRAGQPQGNSLTPGLGPTGHNLSWGLELGSFLDTTFCTSNQILMDSTLHSGQGQALPFPCL